MKIYLITSVLDDTLILTNIKDIADKGGQHADINVRELDFTEPHTVQIHLDFLEEGEG